MQQLSHIGNARREERVLLPALIELRSEQGEETLMADGLDVSPSGLSVRAAFVPEVGTRLHCQFRCPPHDDAVAALGEVVWSSWDGPRDGSFGMRFLELDTKSATAIRRYVEPDNDLIAPAPEPPRVAVMRIDGLAAPIEADVRLLEQDCVVLEQELSFLRLGRGIEVEVPGRGTVRGRIASIELRQGPLDTPTLVFGVLLDEAKQPVFVEHKPRARHAADDSIEQPARLVNSGSALDVDEPFAEPKVAARVAPASRSIFDQPALSDPPPAAAPSFGPASAFDPTISAPIDLASAQPGRSETAPSAQAQRSEVVATPAARSEVAPPQLSEEDLAEERALQNRTPNFVAELPQLWSRVRGALLPTLAALFTLLRKAFASLASDSSPVRKLFVTLARVRLLIGAQFAKWARARSDKKRRTTAQVPRVQQTPAKATRVQRPEPAPANPRNRRILTAALALVGVGLGVYALAPRSGADRIRLSKPLATQEEQAVAAPFAISESTVPAQPAAPTEPVTTQPGADSTAAASEPAEPARPSAVQPRFGEAELPNGRTFTLRMSGPVQSLEGESREDGFTVRIPGRLALDRASPIASSHKAVARALILNRGEYAELTVEFLPGMRPKYQVLGKDNTIEVTLERP